MAIRSLGSAADGVALDALRDPVAGTLRARAANDPKAAVQAAARQFEALFMQQLIKSMRESTMPSGLLENAGTKLGTEMLDVEFANQLTGLRGGLGDAIARQLERQMGAAAPQVGTAQDVPPARSAASAGKTEFLREHRAAAEAAQAQSGIPAAFMMAQAAHETGWGRHEIRHADGSPSHNLFGIKAGANWKGPVAEVVTTEVIDGQPRKVSAKFRAYASYHESFEDYARLMTNSPRYAAVVAHADSAAGFAQGLQRAGYATDPEYAQKLTRVINTTLQLQRATV